jgi:hypothetical protein
VENVAIAHNKILNIELKIKNKKFHRIVSGGRSKEGSSVEKPQSMCTYTWGRNREALE